MLGTPRCKILVQSQHPKQGNHTEISCITEEVEVDIVAESQRSQDDLT